MQVCELTYEEWMNQFTSFHPLTGNAVLDQFVPKDTVETRPPNSLLGYNFFLKGERERVLELFARAVEYSLRNEEEVNEVAQHAVDKENMTIE